MIINNMYFDNMSKAVKFINLNWNNIFNWWNSKKTQNVRKLFLVNYYQTKDNYKNYLIKYLKNELKLTKF